MKNLCLFFTAMIVCCLVAASAVSADSGTEPVVAPVESQLDTTTDAAIGNESTTSASSDPVRRESSLQDSSAPQGKMFTSFQQKLDLMVSAELQGCNIKMCETHADCFGNGNGCHACCFGICMTD